MSSALTPAIKAVVFDAYGTLFDVHSAVMRHAGAVGPDARALSELWRAKQLEYSWVRSLIGRYRDFQALTEEALDFALARFPAVDGSLRAPLLDAYRTLSAYPEVPGALAALAGARADDRDPVQRLARHAGAGGRLRRPRAAARRRALRAWLEAFQAARRRLRAGRGRARRQARAGAVRVVEPLGRGGRGGLRLPRRMGQPRRPADEYDDMPPAVLVSDLGGLL